MRFVLARLPFALIVIGGAAWAPSRLALMFLLPGCCRRSGREGSVPLWAGPALSLLSWAVLLPLLGLCGIGPALGGQAVLTLLAVLFLLGTLDPGRLPKGADGWVPAGIALLLLALRLVPLFQAVGPPGAEVAFHGFVARRVLERQGWPGDLAPQAPGVPAQGFAPALAFLAAAGTGEQGPAGLPRSLLALVCLGQWCVDVGALTFACALSGGLAGSLAALLFALAAPFPQDVSGWGGTGNLLALGAGLFFCVRLARRERPGWIGALGWGAAAGASHALVAALLGIGLSVHAVRRRTLPAWSGFVLGLVLAAGGPLFLVSGPRISPEEREAAIAWGRASGPEIPEAGLGSALAPGRILRERLGAGVAGLALLGVLLAASRARHRLPGGLGPLGLALFGWLLLTGLPGRVWPDLGLIYPERVLLVMLPLVLYGLSVTARFSALLFRGRGRRRWLAEALAGLCLVWWVSGAVRVGYGEVYLGRVVGAGLLARSDLDLLASLSDMVPEGAVVATRHDDAGLWVPALAGRRATRFHTVPPLHEELGAWAEAQPPRFTFTGARPDRGLSRAWTTGSGAWDGSGRVVLRRGNSLLRAR